MSNVGKTIKALYGEDFYRKIGAKGGKAKHPNKGFGSLDKERVSEIGMKGGHASKRGPRR